MTSHGQRGLQLLYNFINLPSVVSGTLGAVTYSFSADGTKVAVEDNSGNGYQYMGSLIYAKSGSTLTLESARFAHGYIAPQDGQVYYHTTDHLGSVRAITNMQGSVVERNGYYPFGSETALGSSYPKLLDNRMKFNGKEVQTIGNLGLLDYGARMYDPAIGRWTAQDPLSEKYYSWSQYNYCVNNPVMFVDLDGRDFEKHIDKENKTITIKATYYADNQTDAVKNAIQFWNDLSGQYKYNINGTEYTLLFDLSLSIDTYATEDLIYTENLNKIDSDGNAISNYSVYLKATVSGSTRDHRIITYNPTKINDYSIPHEIGHTLGMKDVFSDGLMVSDRDSRTHNRVTQENINDMMTSNNAVIVVVKPKSVISTLINFFKK